MNDEDQPLASGKSRVCFEHGRSRCRPVVIGIKRRPFEAHITKRSFSRAPEGPVSIVGVQWRRGALHLVLTSRAGRHVVPYEDYHSISS